MMAKCSLIPPGFFAIDSKKAVVHRQYPEAINTATITAINGGVASKDAVTYRQSTTNIVVDATAGISIVSRVISEAAADYCRLPIIKETTTISRRISSKSTVNHSGYTVNSVEDTTTFTTTILES